MFKPTKAKTPNEYIKMIEDGERRNQIAKIHKFILKNAPKLKPTMYNSVIGYGKFPYETKSGRKGDWFMLGLASQKSYISVYCCAIEGDRYIAEKYSGKIGTKDIGKSCIRFKKFEDINWEELEKLVKESEKIALERGIF